MIAAGLALGVPARVVAAGEPAQVDIRGFHLLTAGDGWLWSGPRLYWTRDAGAHWSDITPPNFERATIRGVFFSDVAHGWLVAVRPDIAGVPAWVLARTPDAGRSWRIMPLALFSSPAAEPMSGAVTLDFVNAQDGWLVVQRMTSSAFSAGVLFRTADGGNTWLRAELPGGNPVYFATSELGWTTAGPLGDQLYRSTDGGRNWSRQFVSADTASAGSVVRYQLPVFDNPRDGVLPVVVNSETDARVAYYVTADGGESWQSAVSVPIEPGVAGGARIPLSVLSSRRWLQASASGGGRMLDVADGQVITARANRDGRAADIVALDMATPASGWAELRSGTCAQLADGQRLCTRQAALLHTGDGGQTWQPLALPSASGTTAPQTPAETKLAAGQGFDACTPGTLTEMATWFATSPYTVVNLYIGGSSLYSGCTLLTPSFVTALAEQGWTFIPTWVGPQAPCTTLTTPTFPTNTVQAQSAGIAEANVAVDRAAALGLTLPDKSATIIYYDMEYFNGGDAPCREAAKAFISGWSGQLRARASMAGVYAVSSVMSDYSAIANVPDDVWMAQWTLGSTYSPTASVWNVPYMSNSVWVNHQRLHQYNGGHDETWGGVTLNVDSDVLDARVAALPCYAFSTGVNVPGAGTALAQSATPCSDGYYANSIVQLQATPGAGYLFTGWSGDASGLTSPLTVTMNNDLSVTANFAAIQSRIYVPYVQNSP